MTGVVKAVVVVMEDDPVEYLLLEEAEVGLGAEVEAEVEVEAAGEVVDFRVQ